MRSANQAAAPQAPIDPSERALAAVARAMRGTWLSAVIGGHQRGEGPGARYGLQGDPGERVPPEAVTPDFLAAYWAETIRGFWSQGWRLAAGTEPEEADWERARPEVLAAAREQARQVLDYAAALSALSPAESARVRYPLPRDERLCVLLDP